MKVGRLSFFDSGTESSEGIITTNDFNAFVPVNGVTTGETETHFSIFGERIAFKKKNDLNVQYSHLCNYGEFYWDVQETYSGKACEPC